MPNCTDCKCACNPIINEQDVINILYRHLPLELCEKIMVFYAPSSKCSICQSILCYNHAGRAKYYHKYYRNYEGYMCDQCFRCRRRWEIS